MLLANLACDNSPSVTIPPPTTTPARPEPKPRPTTDQVRNGPRKTIELGTLPLTIEVPEGWEVKDLEGSSLVMVQGPGPTEDLQFTISPRNGVTADKIKLLESGAKAEQAKNPDLKLVRLRRVGDLQVLEKQSIHQAAGEPTLPGDGSGPTTTVSKTFKWAVQVFVPRNDMFETYDLNFVGLTPELFESDKDFMYQLLDSVKYIGTPK